MPTRHSLMSLLAVLASGSIVSHLLRGVSQWNAQATRLSVVGHSTTEPQALNAEKRNTNLRGRVIVDSSATLYRHV